jgi:hypothetical protein
LNDELSRRPWWDRFTPRVGVRVQLYAAAIAWLVGLSFLLVRGVLFIEDPGPHMHFGYMLLPIVAVAVVLGLVKARLILIRYATKAVTRIETRGHACFFGFFGIKSWVFVLVMMGGGTLLRSSPLVHYWWGRVGLSTLYIAVGTALAIADRIFWLGAVRYRGKPVAQRRPLDTPVAEECARPQGVATRVKSPLIPRPRRAPRPRSLLDPQRQPPAQPRAGHRAGEAAHDADRRERARVCEGDGHVGAHDAAERDADGDRQLAHVVLSSIPVSVSAGLTGGETRP